MSPAPRPPVPLLLALALAACGGAPDPGSAERGSTAPAGAPATGTPTPDPDAGWREGRTSRGHFAVRWRPEGGVLLLNEPLAVEVELERLAEDGSRTPVTGAGLVLQADMPAHGHGMLREPRTTELGGGRYRVEGVLLHMVGEWVVTLDVIADDLAERVDFEVGVE